MRIFFAVKLLLTGKLPTLFPMAAREEAGSSTYEFVVVVGLLAVVRSLLCTLGLLCVVVPLLTNELNVVGCRVCVLADPNDTGNCRLTASDASPHEGVVA